MIIYITLIFLNNKYTKNQLQVPGHDHLKVSLRLPYAKVVDSIGRC
jgi:hypothetical protein